MIILKILLKIIMLPAITVIGFITVIAKLISSFGEFVAGVLIIAATIMMIYNGMHHNWSQLAYSASVGLMVFVINFVGKMMAVLFR